MITIIKEYTVASGQLQFEFSYNPVHASLTDFEIVNVSPLKKGYDSGDARNVTVYPSNIDITITDVTGDNYSGLRALYEQYTNTYPYTQFQTFYLIIRLNGLVIFKGVLDQLESDNSDATLSLSFVDGVNLFKNTQIGNPYVLQKLANDGVIPRYANDPYVNGYGFGGVNYNTITSNGGRKGYVPVSIETGDKEVSLRTAIYSFVSLLNPDINIDFQNRFKFGNTGVEISNYAGIEQVRIRRICSDLVGRYIAITKQPDRVNAIGYNPDYPEYAKPEYFDLVFENEFYAVYRHNWSGNFPIGVNEKRWNVGLDEVKVSDLLHTLARNLFSYFGFKNSDMFFFRHKRYNSNPVDLTSIADMRKILTVERVTQVRVNDYYTANYGTEGNDYNKDEEVIEFKIPLNAYPISNGYYYNLVYGSSQPVIYFYDQELRFRDIPQETIAHAEWESFRIFRDQYDFTLNGIGYEFDATYRVNYGNYSGNMRPITIEEDLLNDTTRMTALEI